MALPDQLVQLRIAGRCGQPGRKARGRDGVGQHVGGEPERALVDARTEFGIQPVDGLLAELLVGRGEDPQGAQGSLVRLPETLRDVLLALVQHGQAEELPVDVMTVARGDVADPSRRAPGERAARVEPEDYLHGDLSFRSVLSAVRAISSFCRNDRAFERGRAKVAK
jgi:hypothetical protein